MTSWQLIGRKYEQTAEAHEEINHAQEEAPYGGACTGTCGERGQIMKLAVRLKPTLTSEILEARKLDSVTFEVGSETRMGRDLMEINPGDMVEMEGDGLKALNKRSMKVYSILRIPEGENHEK